MAIITVSGNSTGDYNCDGVDDHVEINQALVYARDHPNTTVYLKGPFTYTIGAKLQIGSSTILTGDSSARIKLKDAAAWAVDVPLIDQLVNPLSNVEIYGFEIDGNAGYQASPTVLDSCDNISTALLTFTYGTGTVTLDTTEKAEGTGSFYISGTADAGGSFLGGLNCPDTVVGSHLFVKFKLKSSHTGILRVVLYVADGIYNFLNIPTIAGSWQSYCLPISSGTKTGTATTIQYFRAGYYLNPSLANAACYYWLDDVKLDVDPPLGLGFYNIFSFTAGTNVRMHDMYLHDGTGDGIKATSSTTVLFYNNTVNKLGNDGVRLIGTTGEVYNNKIWMRQSCGCHLVNSPSVTIYNNTIKSWEQGVTGGEAGIHIEDTTGASTNIEVYGNVLQDCYGQGIKITETGTGWTNPLKNLYVHHNTIKGAGGTTLHNSNGGIVHQGFSGARIENNIIDGCYNAGIYSKDVPTAGVKIYFNDNIITNTVVHSVPSLRAVWSGCGFVNLFPTLCIPFLRRNIVTKNAWSDYEGDGGNALNDVATSPPPRFAPPVQYILDETRNYYIDGHTAYINGFPFNWTAKKVGVGKSVSQLKPPGIDGWAIDDFGFEGADITIDCFADSLVEAWQVIAAFKKPGTSILELGGEYEGWQITGTLGDYSSVVKLESDTLDNLYSFSILFLASKPIMESVHKRVRARRITADGDQWSSDDVYTGNLIKNPSFETWAEGQTDVAPTDWTLVTTGESQSTVAIDGGSSLQIVPDGTTAIVGSLQQPMKFETGIEYTLSGHANISGLTQGAVHVDIYAGGAIVAELVWSADSTEWVLDQGILTFSVSAMDAMLRVYADGTPNLGALLYVDNLILQKTSEYDSVSVGNAVVTSGSVDIYPDIVVSAAYLSGGTYVENGTTVHNNSGSYSTTSTSWALATSYTLTAVSGKRHRIDRISGTIHPWGGGATSTAKVTIQAASINGGAELQIGTDWATTTSLNYAVNPYSMAGDNEQVVVRWYAKTSSGSYSAITNNSSFTCTLLATSYSATGVQLSNTADPLSVMDVCSVLHPGCTIAIRGDETGYFRYIENFSDITYQKIVYGRSGDTLSTVNKTLTFTSTGYLAYCFDVEYPITGIPYVVIYVVSGSPLVSIALDNGSGAPGTYYVVDQNSNTDVSNTEIYRELNNNANLKLKGSTKFYVKIYPQSGETAVIGSIFLYTDIITVDAQRIKIFATGAANTFEAGMTAGASMIVSLQYRDAHSII